MKKFYSEDTLTNHMRVEKFWLQILNVYTFCIPKVGLKPYLTLKFSRLSKIKWLFDYE